MKNTGLFSALRKTRESLSSGLTSLFHGATEVDDALFEEIEDLLITSDMGIDTTSYLMDALKKKCKAEKVTKTTTLYSLLRSLIVQTFKEAPKELLADSDLPKVILMVGVNGVGKTTTTAKLAHSLNNQGYKVLLAACDTFRAAAVSQLESWGDKLNIPIISQAQGSDAAAVAYDAISAAIARKMDFLIIDTAGRQHTHTDLMSQLEKIQRVLVKANPKLQPDAFITVDAGNGQNILSQIKHFNQHIHLTGVCATKMDGTAKGGILLSVAHQFDFPIRYIGVGEGIEDLKPFNAQEFTNALLPDFQEK